MIKLTLPIPDSKLSPNRKNGKNWISSHSIKKDAQKQGYLSAYQAWHISKLVADKTTILRCDLKVYHKSKIHLDDDNLVSALKPYQDGIFAFLEQKIQINDKQIRYRTIDTLEMDKLNPRVIMTLSAIERKLCL
jgi:hypothetical protein